MKWRQTVLAGSFIFSAIFANGQNSVGIGVANPNKNAVLELISPGHNQGLLIPKLTTAQRTATSFTAGLSTKENGLMVFDSDEKKFYYWEATAWKEMAGSNLAGGNGITIVNNTISTVPQDLQLSGTNLTITNNASAVPISLSSLNIPQDIKITGTTLTVTNNPSAVPVNLSDLNIPQDLNLSGSTLTITNNPTATPVNLSAFTGTNTDDQALSYNGVTGDLTITKLSGGPQTVNIPLPPATTPPSGTAGGELSGSYPNPIIASNVINSGKIADGSIVGLDISDNTISSVDIFDNSIASVDIADNTIVDADINAAAGIVVSKLAPGANGNVLTTTAGATAWASLPASVTSVATGTGLTGGPITSTGTIALSNTGVGAASYGSATTTPVITVDLQGRITSASNATIAGVAPAGAAGGDLTGNYPIPVVANNAITSAKILDGAIVSADILDGTVASVDITDGTIAAADIALLAVNDTHLAIGAVTSAKILDGTIASADIALLAVNDTHLATGAVTGAKILDGTVASVDILDGTIATADIAAGAVTDTQIASGIAVSKLTAGTLTNVLTSTAGGTAWAPLPAFGTVNSVATGTGLTGGPITNVGTISLANTAVTPAVYGSASASAVITVDAQGRITNAASAPISGVVPGGAAGGDLTSNYPNPVIAADAVTSAKILDNTVSTADIANLTITDADVSATAGLDVSKFSPGTSGQILTTSAGLVAQWANPGGTLLIQAPGTRNLVAGSPSGGVTGAGADNTFYGTQAGNAATTGQFNVAIGSQTGNTHTTGTLNTIIGWHAGLGAAPFAYNGNTFIGAQAGRDATTGPNTFIGEKSGLATTGGTLNVFIGNLAGSGNLTGASNTMIGYQAGVASITGNNNTLLGYQTNMTGAGAANYNNSMALGYQATVDASNKVRLGNNAITVIEGQVAFTNPSDRRFKTNIKTIEGGLDLIMKLRPVSYNMKNSTDTRLNWGFIAQEIEEIVGDKNSVLTVSQDIERHLGLRYTDFIAPLVKAVQEQQEQITDLNGKLSESEKKVDQLMAEIEQIKKAIGLKASNK